ncbi:MAG TPA: PaaI family thioesterase [Vicinamibacterales bacterium]|nr:PaaI family thioesterase [Vicinamibacterales bacterium]
MTAPVARPEAGWEPVTPFPSPEDTFLHEGDRVRIAYFRKPNEPELYAKAYFGVKTMGPPGHVHGGAMAAALDEAMGAVCWMNDHRVVAATITVKFLAMLKIETETTLEAAIDRVEGRKVYTRAALISPEGQRVTESEGLFIILKDEVLRAMRG